MERFTPTDPELLTEWLGQGREEAFHALVARYAGLVAATARRICGDDSMVAEVSQLTFITLARKAKSLTSCASLGGWLHATALMHARNLLRKARSENRKRQLLRTSMEDGSSHAPHDVWKDMQPVLDDALASLSEKDRQALLLRFYRSLTIREIASTLGIATDAAQKRVDRATGRLRGQLARRGCHAGGSLAAAMLAGFAVDLQAAVPLVPTLTKNALAATVTSSASTIGFATLVTTATMKTTSFVPPLVSLVVAAVVMGHQRQSISEVEDRSNQMRDRLAMHVERVSRAKSRVFLSEDKSPIDWQELAHRLSDETVARRFQKRLESMSVQELIRSIREVAVLDFTHEDRMSLEDKLVPRLIELDPEVALAHFADQLGRVNPNWRLPEAFGRWLEKDQSRAIAWLDEQIAAGRFRPRRLDGSDGAQASFEAHAIAVLLRQDPASAGRRLSALGGNDRENAIRSIGDNPDIDPLEFARLARQELSESACNESLSLQASRLVVGTDLAPASRYLDQIKATPGERADAVAEVIGKGLFNIMTRRRFVPDDLVSIRKWVSDQAPGKLGEATGVALGTVSIQESHQMDFSEVLKLVYHYHDAGDGDSLLFHFLDATYPEDEANRRICRELANKITDETRREEILERFR